MRPLFGLGLSVILAGCAAAPRRAGYSDPVQSPAAAEFLPPDSVERVVLLAPSVSAEYDLGPALACAREGIDVFHSGRDRAYLGLGVRLLGTADRHWSDAAGRVGFRVPAACPDPL